jgi:hypothetical protein
MDEVFKALTRLDRTPSSKQHSELGHCAVGTGVDRVLLMQHPYPWNNGDKKGVRIRLRWTSRPQEVVIFIV